MTMKARHTPGPWPIRQVAGGCWNVEIGEQPISFRREADARLIAAAPDLLKACLLAQKVIDHAQTISDWQPWVEREIVEAKNCLAEALASVEGRTP